MYTREKVLAKIRMKLTESIKKSFEVAEVPNFLIEVPKEKEHGDFSTNAAMLMAGARNKSPKDIAVLIAQNFDKGSLVERVETAGSGFINLFLYPDYIYEVLADIEQGNKDYGRIEDGRGKQVRLESASLVPTEQVHMEDVRGGVIADSLEGLLYMAGYQVTHQENGTGHHVQITGIKGSEHEMRIIAMGHTRLIKNGETRKIISLSHLLEDIGVDAVRFFFSLKPAVSHFDFDLGLAAEQSNDNPVFYVQYAHARICAIIRILGEEGIFVRPYAEIVASLLNDEHEMRLIKRLSDFPEEIRMAAATCEPSRIARYTIDTAALFHSFYNACHVKTENRALSEARLKLVDSTRIVITNALSVLKVNAPEKM